MATVLVVLPTYNRSNVLRLAVLSVLGQDEVDWQLLVIADGCTDDTAAVMAQFTDGRVNFLSRAQNSGNMAEPINFAVAEGLHRWPDTVYIALLSHDDLWLPDHLSNLRKVFDSGVNFALAPYFECLPAGLVAQRHSGQTRYTVWLKPVTMSSWMVCASLWKAVGRWRTPAEIIDAPSADWRYRAWRCGARFGFAAHASAIVINSVLHKQSYRHRVASEQTYWSARLALPELRQQLQIAALESAQTSNASSPLVAMPLLRRLLKSVRFRLLHMVSLLLQGVAPFVGFSPGTVELWFFGHRRGSYVEQLMQQRGLHEP